MIFFKDKQLILIGGLALMHSEAFANVVWPGLIIAQRMVVWAIPVGLFVETIIFKKAKPMGFGRALWIIFVVNLFSTIIGALGAAIGGLAWEVSVGVAFYRLLDIGTFNPATWIFTLGLAIYLSYFFEMKGLKWLFKIELDKRDKRLFAVANAISTLVAFGSTLVEHPF